MVPHTHAEGFEVIEPDTGAHVSNVTPEDGAPRERTLLDSDAQAIKQALG